MKMHDYSEQVLYFFYKQITVIGVEFMRKCFSSWYFDSSCVYIAFTILYWSSYLLGAFLILLIY